MTQVSFFGHTDVGRVRTNNEDAYLVCNIWDDEHVLAVVIDGVGGYEGGEVAAELARDSILEFLTDHPEGDCLDLLKRAVIYANNCIYQERSYTSELSNMSCVLTASLIELASMRVNVAHVGDTRIYQFSNDQIEKLSHDHSLIGYREEIGDLTEEEAMNHPQRNIISRDVGSSFLEEQDTSYVEVASYPLESKNQLLLCSDGLCDMITSKRMSQILSLGRPVEEKVRMLIDAALDAGGRDNVTVVLVDIESDEEDITVYEEEAEEIVPVMTDEEKHEKSVRKNWHSLIAASLFVAGFVAGVFCGPLILGDKNTAADKKSADSTLVEPADSISQRDSLESDELAINDSNSDIQQNVDNENQ